MDEQASSQPPNENASSGSDGTNIRELALALVAAHYPDAADDTEPQLLPGQLPPNFPGDFPLPPGSRVVGSLVAARPTIVLDTDQSPEAVITFYTEQLAAAGWSAQESMPPRRGGFIHADPGMAGRAHAMFYRDDGPALQVMTLTTPGRRTSALISQMPEGMGPMRRGTRGRMMHHDIFSILPSITPPPNARQYAESSSGGNDRVTSNAHMETELDLSTLATHYVAQLEQGGWQRTGSDENGPVAWSTWNFESEEQEPWRALLVILKRPDMPHRYWLQIVTEWIGNRSQSGMTGASSSAAVGWLGWQSHTT